MGMPLEMYPQGTLSSAFRPPSGGSSVRCAGAPRQPERRGRRSLRYSVFISNCTRSTGICQRATGCIGEDINVGTPLPRCPRYRCAIPDTPGGVSLRNNNAEVHRLHRRERRPRRSGAQREIASPGEWCSAQRIINPMIAGGNHTTIPSCQKNGPKGPIF